VQGFRELPELLESSGQNGASALLNMPCAAAAAELICDTKQEGEQRFIRLNTAKVPHRGLVNCCRRQRGFLLLA